MCPIPMRSEPSNSASRPRHTITLAQELLPRMPERPCLALTWLLSCNLLLLPDGSHRSFDSVADSSGRYAISAPPGQYSVCVHPGPQSLYLDPCQWFPPLSVNLAASAASVLPLNLQKGVRLILRLRRLPFQHLHRRLIKLTTHSDTFPAIFISKSTRSRSRHVPPARGLASGR